MHATTTTCLLTALLLASVACSSVDTDDARSPSTASSTPSTSASASEEPVPVEEPGLIGAWSADLTEEGFIEAITAAGYSRKAAGKVAKFLPGPDFRLEFLDDQFRLSYAPEDEQFMSGSVMVSADTVTLDDEAPVGTIGFTYALEGDELTLTEPVISNPEIELSPGVPDALPAVGFLGGATWARAE